MAEQLDALFNRAASGEHDSEFLFAVHSYHFDLHMRIADYGAGVALREMIDKSIAGGGDYSPDDIDAMIDEMAARSTKDR